MNQMALPLLSLSQIQDKEAIVVDTETTGLHFSASSPECDEYGPDRICSFSAILVRRTSEGGWGPVSQRTSHFSPGRPVAPGAARVNKFFWSDNDKPAPAGLHDLRACNPFAASAQAILDYIDGRLIVAHNAPFDLEGLDEEMIRAGMPPLEGKYACTRAAFAEKVGLGRGHPRAWGTRLDDLCSSYGIPRGARAKGHGAAVDAGLCAEGFAYLDFEGLMETCPIASLPHRTVQQVLRP